ncbi:MAG TPA: phosphotransferase family protein [Streptosporangiaceae bacterium]
MSAAETGDPPGVDTAALRAYLETAAPGLVGGPLRAELIAGGKSNLTYVVGDGRAEWVLRRPPLGHVLPTAHNMAREYEVISALHGTAVPVPETYVLCADESVLGAPFYLMSHVPGVVYRTGADLAGFSAADGRAVSTALVDVLAALHSVRPDDVGLVGFGRPEGYLERQVRRWTKQLAASRSRDLPGIEELAGRLAASVPSSARVALLHGDYKLDNVLVDAGDPGRIGAVLDWEMSTLGDPLADLGLVLVYWERGDRHADSRVPRTSEIPGFLTADDVIARYADRTGTDVGDIGWYRALGGYKLAVISEGIHYRYVQGLTVGEGFANAGDIVPSLVARAHEVLDGVG